MTSDEYFDNDEFKEILSEYEQGKGAGPALFLDADDLTDIADYYLITGDEKKATEAIDTALEKYPGATGPLVYKAREALQNEDLQAAMDYADQIEAKDEADYCYMQAEILIAQDKIDEADKLLEGYYEKVGEEIRDDFLLDVGEQYVDYGVFDRAFHWLSMVEDTDSTDYKELMGKALIGTRRLDESISIMNELIDQNPYSKQYWNMLATAHMLNGDYDEAVSSSEYAIAIDPLDTISLLTKARSLYKMGNYEEALKFFQQYCDLVPNSDEGELNIGTCLLNMSRNEEAIEHLLKAEQYTSETSLNQPIIYQELAFAYGETNECEKALEYVEKTKSIGFQPLEMEVMRGHILLQMGKVENAQNVFWQAISDSDSDPDIVLRVIVSIYDNGYVNTAYKLFRKLFAIAPPDFNEGYSYMALCCRDLRRVREFLKYIRLAATSNPYEAKKVLGCLFPEGLQPSEYYEYMVNKINKK